MLDKTSVVTGLASEIAQVIFQRSQRTDPIGPLNDDAPGQGQQVRPQHIRVAQHQCATEYGEDDKCEVQNQDKVSEQAVDHFDSTSERRSNPSGSEDAVEPQQ